MSEPRATPENSPWGAGCIVALGLGFLTVALFYGSLVPFFGPPDPIPAEEWPFFLLQVLIAATPFGFLALSGIRSKWSWVTAIVLTVVFWGAFYVSVLTSARDQTGANIGMALIMLVSPLFIGGGAWLVAQLTRRS